MICNVLYLNKYLYLSLSFVQFYFEIYLVFSSYSGNYKIYNSSLYYKLYHLKYSDLCPNTEKERNILQSSPLDFKRRDSPKQILEQLLPLRGVFWDFFHRIFGTSWIGCYHGMLVKYPGFDNANIFQPGANEILRISLSSMCPSTDSSGALDRLKRAFSFTNFVADNVNFRTRFSKVSCINTSANFSLDAFKSFIKTATRTFSKTKCVARTNVVK